MMREAEVPVTFLPADRTVYVLEETRLIEAAADAEIILDSPCGGKGTCGKCRVQIQTQASKPTDSEKAALSHQEISQGFRLACQTTVQGPTKIVVPESSLLAVKHQILIHAEKIEIQGDDQPSGIEHSIATCCNYTIACDVGTTTLAAMLLDRKTANDMAVASRLNPQTRYGDDVISRIRFAGESPNGLQILQASIVQAINEMINELCSTSGIDNNEIGCIALSGNTTMQQLLCCIDTTSLGKVPFVPASTFGISLDASDLGLRIHPQGQAYILPIIGGFVGGDTVGGILATELTDMPGPTLLVDIGTNGEIVLWANGKLLAASTAAGPAFEGARISCGMRGGSGAIEKVVVDGHLRINVIGNVPPTGLCGSGLIDVAAELLRYKILNPQGKLLTPDQLPPDILPDLRRRVVLYEGKAAFLLASEEESATGRPLVVTQRDFRELQLASGAIRAGIAILLNRAGLKPEDLNAVFIAGGFGNFIRRNNAQRMGLLPTNIEHHRIYYRGNTSLAGARLTAVSLRARQMAEQLARSTEHIDLSTDPDFQQIFTESMLFPAE
jgi:uncharacterized 2Fe-2S/4Fe-4S cluster protein (DUF4445 family)